MMNILKKALLILSVNFLLSLNLFCNVKSETGAHERKFSFTPPKGWQCISDKEQLPSKVEIVYIGKAKDGFTPSINVATEETKMALQSYVLFAKSYHESGGALCVDLGDIDTKSGKATLLQIDRKTQFGPVRFLQASLLKEGVAYVMTATSLEKDFLRHSQDFFNAIQTLEIYSTHPLVSE